MEATAALIAACNPTAIRSLLSRLEEAEREVQQLRALLPGVFYMDPPDGGSVSVVEQFARMAADAARFIWLKEHPLWTVGYRVKRNGGHVFKEWRMRDEGDYWGQWWKTPEQAIDAAMKEQSHG